MKTFILFICHLLKCIIVIVSLLLMVAYSILLERKILGSIQKRRGPNVIGFLGLLQPIADALKLITKETIVPALANKTIFLFAPTVTLFLSMLHWAILPFNEYWVIADINVGILYFFAVSSLGSYGIIMSGWSSNSKYALLGCLRSAAQIIAYEVSIGLVLIGVIVVVGSLNFSEIVLTQQNGFTWYILPFFFLFLLFLISCLAETNRPPFDLPEAEAELVSGYNVEYSAMTFGYFFLAEYLNIITVCTVNVIIFLGGWSFFGWTNIFIFSLKIFFLVTFFIWVRGSLPRYRYDQLMHLGWKGFLPLALGLILLIIGLLFFIKIFF